jgi:hypothetical protein
MSRECCEVSTTMAERCRRVINGWRSVTLSRGALACCAFLAAALLQQGAQLRTISGVVTDDHHEPLRGAVVELENGSSHDIVSFITAADGKYVFKRLDSHTDFTLWATFRGNKSSTHSISMFDSHPEKVVDIVCKTF